MFGVNPLKIQFKLNRKSNLMYNELLTKEIILAIDTYYVRLSICLVYVLIVSSSLSMMVSVSFTESSSSFSRKQKVQRDMEIFKDRK